MPSSPPIWAQHPPMEAEHDFAVHGIPSPYESYQRAPPPPTPPSRPMEQRFLEPPMPPRRSYGAHVKGYTTIGVARPVNHRALPSFVLPGQRVEEYGESEEPEPEEERKASNASSRVGRTAEPAGIPIEDKLLRRAKLAEAKKEALRERAIQQEMKLCKEKPTISKNAAKRAYSQPLYIRSQSRVAQKKKDLEAATEAANLIAEEEARKYTFKPKITKRGRMSIGKATTTDPIVKQHKIERAVHEQAAEDLAECIFKPEINTRSAKIVQYSKRKSTASGPTYTHVDSLLDRSEQARLKNYLKVQAEVDAMQPGTPAISPYAARKGGGSIVKRLHPDYSIPVRSPSHGSRGTRTPSQHEASHDYPSYHTPAQNQSRQPQDQSHYTPSHHPSNVPPTSHHSPTHAPEADQNFASHQSSNVPPQSYHTPSQAQSFASRQSPSNVSRHSPDPAHDFASQQAHSQHSPSHAPSQPEFAQNFASHHTPSHHASNVQPPSHHTTAHAPVHPEFAQNFASHHTPSHHASDVQPPSHHTPAHAPVHPEFAQNFASHHTPSHHASNVQPPSHHTPAHAPVHPEYAQNFAPHHTPSHHASSMQPPSHHTPAHAPAHPEFAQNFASHHTPSNAPSYAPNNAPLSYHTPSHQPSPYKSVGSPMLSSRTPRERLL